MDGQMDGRESRDLKDQEQTKFRRVNRACLPCRSRKQRCMPTNAEPGEAPSCRRCRNLGITCSFATQDPIQPNLSASPSNLAQLVVDLERRLNSHENRISQLESLCQCQRPDEIDLSLVPGESQAEQGVGTQDDHQSDDRFGHGSTTLDPAFNMDSVDLGPPIARLQNLRAIGETRDPVGILEARTAASTRTLISDGTHDPIAHGVLTFQEAQRAISIFFSQCQPMAPFLDTSTNRCLRTFRLEHTNLLLAVCAIGCRFMNAKEFPEVLAKLSKLTAMLDELVSELILRPSASDLNIDSVSVLLLYVQWMPLNTNVVSGSVTDAAAHKLRKGYSRYSDIRAWSVLGSAARFASLLGLGKDATTNDSEATALELSRSRVWRNLLTCDCNLMLSSGFPMTANPTAVLAKSPKFGNDVMAQEPGDSRITALVELVNIIYSAIYASGASSGRQLDLYQIGRLNMEMDVWATEWVSRLQGSESQANRLPFTSWRWYRLALNTAPLGSLLFPTRNNQSAPNHRQLPLLQSLDISVRTASHILLALSTHRSDVLSLRGSSSDAVLPIGPFDTDNHATTQLLYSVDSTWVNLTFSVAFLVLAYLRGTIDESLNICLMASDSSQTRAPHLPSPASPLSHLAQLAIAIFEDVCHNVSVHPARDFKETVQNVVSLIVPKQMAPEMIDAALDGTADQNLWDIMADTGVDWAGLFPGPDLDFGSTWPAQPLSIP